MAKSEPKKGSVRKRSKGASLRAIEPVNIIHTDPPNNENGSRNIDTAFINHEEQRHHHRSIIKEVSEMHYNDGTMSRREDTFNPLR